MALVPEYLLSALSPWEDDWELYRPSRLVPWGRVPFSYLRPWRSLNAEESGVSNIINTKDQLKINLDVQQFKPNEISVKVADKYVVIEGKHEEKPDEHGFISRHFQRRYLLPDDVDPNTVVSQLSSDGVLSIEAPKKQAKVENQRTVPITVTNKPAIKQEKRKEEGKVEKMQQ